MPRPAAKIAIATIVRSLDLVFTKQGGNQQRFEDWLTDDITRRR
ncbi:MAG: hypothetical protein U7126_08135 [Microcoleus sp.]